MHNYLWFTEDGLEKRKYSVSVSCEVDNALMIKILCYDWNII